MNKYGTYEAASLELSGVDALVLNLDIVIY